MCDEPHVHVVHNKEHSIKTEGERTTSPLLISTDTIDITSPIYIYVPSYTPYYMYIYPHIYIYIYIYTLLLVHVYSLYI